MLREIDTTIRIISGYEYRKKPNLETAKSYVDSIHSETNRLEDNYFFWISKNGLIDPKTHDYLENLITPDSHWNPYLGLVEYSILWQLNEWSKKPESKMSVWFSTELKAENEYPDNKIVIHTITESPSGQKKLENKMLIFECPREKAFQIAKQLFPNQTKNLKTAEELRCLLLDVGNDVSITDILNKVSLYIPIIEDYQPMTDDIRTYIGELISQGEPSSFVAQEMLRLKVLGPRSLGCAQSYSDILNANSLFIRGKDQYGSLEFRCPSCDRKNTRPFGQLIPNCQHCGADVRC